MKLNIAILQQQNNKPETSFWIWLYASITNFSSMWITNLGIIKFDKRFVIKDCKCNNGKKVLQSIHNKSSSRDTKGQLLEFLYLFSRKYRTKPPAQKM